MLCESIFTMSRHPVVEALGKLQAHTPASAIAAYVVFGTVAFAIHHFVADGAFSSVITMASVVQLLGISFLCIKVISSGSAAGISAGSITLDAVALCLRLSSTTWLNGYLPVDASGDYAMQVIDCCSVLALLWLLRRVVVVHRDTYQVDDDTFRTTSVVIGCLLAAIIFHADEDRRFVFDTLWMTGLFVSVMAVLPQLWLTTKNGGKTDALTSHYIAALALSRIMSGMFMWAARNTISCSTWIPGVNQAVIAIFGAHAIHLLLLCDFAYYYMQTVLKQGFGETVDLSAAGETMQTWI